MAPRDYALLVFLVIACGFISFAGYLLYPPIGVFLAGVAIGLLAVFFLYEVE